MTMYYKATCVRCGFTRSTETDHRSPLCRDCKDVLTAEERQVWEDEQEAAA